MHKTVSIIGFGWLGNFIAAHLSEKGYTIRASTTTPSKLNNIRSKGYDGYLLNLEQGIEKNNALLESSFHVLCVPPSVVKGDYGAIILNYVSNVQNDKPVFFISSTGVYSKKTGNYDETSETIPGKLSDAENNIRLTVSSHFILRCAGLIGPGRHPGNFLAGKKNLEGPQSTVNLIHAADICGMLYALMQTQAYGIYNLGLEAPEPKIDFYTKACAAIKTVAPEFNIDSASNKRIVDTKKALNVSSEAFMHTHNFYRGLLYP